ncbi:hypothetical protein [uncultured Roseobacter sp.]|uniref:hypothetical protein n=1 Tax=uncultured Roseobacter sp. TaxID=114847 RepID=UPI00260413F2|nr:hypothetical protein [uncultured Roseobacter sp.]
MATAENPPALPLWQRLFYAIPVIGWVARDVSEGDESNIWFALILFVSLWMCSALIFGLPGLYLPAVAMVPVIFILLLMITWG